ncbi:chitin synthase [Mytilus galloprovincialis]|uniref:chitin synthase n=1 Tax=Mytilus galloprovincialis TaxID=29158 RepID=A0A8B6F384_MYTGA|nr:chitin synthase [Mytilus galloprovincialis]
MYLYYLIGYKLVNTELKNEKDVNDFRSAPDILKNFPSLNQKVENTYIMALDGDVDFSPEALQLLLDRMKKNTKVGATCGRIKPGGSGPVVWYQKFEYAIGHWLQKSAEHVFGCVLCSPGCFSLFRAKALMDDNIMRTYANVPTEPKHYIQYDQGEDRWLCTLLLQQGKRIEYCAAAEALTFAPEDFREFFNQRRRWLPSTMANNLDILMNYKQITKKKSMSHLYFIYQVILLMASVLGPSTVLLAMQSAIRTVFSTSAIVAYILTYGPAILFIFICLKFKSQTQLTIAMILSAIYAMLMMAVVVGTIVNISEEGFFTQSAVFMYVLVGVYLIAGLFHPHELTDLFWGVLYFICIPAGYLFLIIYAICNLNNVSWGTRETQKAVLECQTQGTHKKKKTEEEFGIVSVEVIENILKQVKSRKNQDSPCLDLVPSIFQWINNFVILRSLESVVSIFKNTVADDEIVKADGRSLMQKSMGRTMTKFLIHEDKTTDENSWANAHGTMGDLDQDEYNFWIELIDKYLKPLNPDEKKEKAVDESLKNFRNKVAFAFFFVNGLWLVIMTAMNEVKNVLNITIQTFEEFTIIIEPLGLLFIVIFALLLFLQFFGMIRHRYGTFLHLIAATNLRKRKRKGSSSSTEQKNENTNAQNMGNETRTIRQNGHQIHLESDGMSMRDIEESV